MRKKISIIIFFTVVLIGFMCTKSNAAISATSATVNSGDTVSIKITSNPGVATYKVNLTNNGGLTFLSCSGGTVGGTSVADTQNKNMTSLATYNFRVPTVSTDTTYTVTFSATGMETVDLQSIDNSTASAKITVRGNSNNNGGSDNGGSDNGGTTSKSSNANLKNLGITPNDFSGFKANTTTYNVTVPYNVESVKVYANAQDSKSTITGAGTKKLKEGTNSIAVVVTAEDGTKKTYTINVTRKSEEDNNMTPNVVDEPKDDKPEKLFLTAIALQNDLNLSLSPSFSSDIYEYKVEVESTVEKIEVSGIPNIDGAKVEIVGNTNLVEGENIITLTVKSDGYADVVYKIKVTRKSVNVVAEEKNQDPINMIDLNNSSVRIKVIIIASVVAFIIIAIIVILILRNKKKSKRLYSSYYDYYNDNSSIDDNVDVLKEMDNNENANTKELKKNIMNDEINFDTENVPEGYTAEISDDDEQEERLKRKKGKGKHF